MFIINKIRLYLCQLLKFLGPAFIISVAYIDPGNFATNISGGSQFNYTLLWVILWSNILAIFLQINSAKLGIATGKNLSEMCAKKFSKPANWILWIVAQMATIATTMAEFLGGAIGFNLLFHIPLLQSTLLTAIISLGIVYLQKYGQKIVEVVITFLVAIICIAYGIEMFLAKPDWALVAYHTIVPSIPNNEALYIAVGMLGATVMPHVIYLHSQLVQCRNVEDKKKHLFMEKIDIIFAMNIAFIVNAAMVIVSAAVFFKDGILVNSIEDAHRSLAPLLGRLSSGAFGIALLASGFSSSAVGAMAGETVISGFVNLKIPLILRRIATMLPSIIIIILCQNPMQALILSQVSLSFALPFAVIPMFMITNDKKLMGEFVNKSITKLLGYIIISSVILLNIFLIVAVWLN